jgi:8-oxo-dGTP pyrophosphatase MutT (NUDIX family)
MQMRVTHDGKINVPYLGEMEAAGLTQSVLTTNISKKLADEDIIYTAIREAQEETGIDPDKISVIGTLTPLFIPVSNMIVTPVVGWTDTKPAFNHQPEEVVFLIEADIRILLDQVIVKTKPFNIRGEMVSVKYFDYEGNVIWGATAMLIHELLTIIKKIGIL